MAEQGHGEQHAGQHAEPPGAQAPADDAEEEQPDREAQREGELAGQRGEQVAAVDGEAGLEQEGQGGGGQARRQRVAQSGQAAERPGADGQEHAAEDGHQLEGHVVGEEGVEEDDDQTRQREVEGVEGVAVVPAGVPAGEASLGQEVVLEEGR